MWWMAIALCSSYGLCVCASITCALALVWKLRRPAAPQPAEPAPVSVLLPLRGADPQLADGLRRLMQQDYPQYELRIVIDGLHDPVWETVRAARESCPRAAVFVEPLREKSELCSPQCSALAQALDDADPRSEIIVIVDGDVKAHPSWLRELTAPLADPAVGVAHGNRWFAPPDARWGTLMRYLWNIPTVFVMWRLRMPWAGTFAIRRSALESSGLAAAWRRSITPDTLAHRLLAPLGLEIRFVPQLMMLNGETCSLAFAHDFVRRQMTWTRLYHGRFAPVAVVSLLGAAWLLAAPLLAIAALFTGDPAAGAVGLAGLAALWLAWLTETALLDREVRRLVRQRGEATPPFPLRAAAALPAAIAVAWATHLSAVLLALWARRVVWRGVTYDVTSADRVRVLDDRFLGVEMAQAASANESV